MSKMVSRGGCELIKKPSIAIYKRSALGLLSLFSLMMVTSFLISFQKKIGQQIFSISQDQFFYCSQQVEWSIGFGVGVIATMAFDYIYDNYKDDVIDVGKKAVNAVSDAENKVGDAVSGFGKTLGSVFG